MSVNKGQIHIKDSTLKQIIVDPMNDCLYLQFNYEKVSKTLEHSDYVFMDFDASGDIVGVELIGVKNAHGDLKNIFYELSKDYNRPDLKKVPSELKRDLRAITA